MLADQTPHVSSGSAIRSRHFCRSRLDGNLRIEIAKFGGEPQCGLSAVFRGQALLQGDRGLDRLSIIFDDHIYMATPNLHCSRRLDRFRCRPRSYSDTSQRILKR